MKRTTSLLRKLAGVCLFAACAVSCKGPTVLAADDWRITGSREAPLREGARAVDLERRVTARQTAEKRTVIATDGGYVAVSGADELLPYVRPLSGAGEALAFADLVHAVGDRAGGQQSTQPLRLSPSGTTGRGYFNAEDASRWQLDQPETVEREGTETVIRRPVAIVRDAYGANSPAIVFVEERVADDGRYTATPLRVLESGADVKRFFAMPM